MKIKFSTWAPPDDAAKAGTSSQPQGVVPVVKKLKRDRITLEVLESLYHLPLAVAALKLDVSETYLKARCRAQGVYRWPFRKNPKKPMENRKSIAFQQAEADAEEVQLPFISVPPQQRQSSSDIFEDPSLRQQSSSDIFNDLAVMSSTNETVPNGQVGHGDPLAQCFIPTACSQGGSNANGLNLAEAYLAAISGNAVAQQQMQEVQQQVQQQQQQLSRQPAPAPQEQINQNLSSLTTAAGILKKAALRFSFIELWLPAMDRSQLVFDADTCAINPQAPQVAMSAFRDFSKRITFKKGDGIPGRVWETQRPELRSNVQTLSEQAFHRKSLSIATGLKGAVAWPVVSGGEMCGVLCAFFDHPLNQAKEIDDVKQIQQVAQQLGDALRQESELRAALGLFATECELFPPVDSF